MSVFEKIKSSISIAWLLVATGALFVAHQFAENGRYRVQGPIMVDTRKGMAKPVGDVLQRKVAQAKFDWNQFPLDPDQSEATK